MDNDAWCTSQEMIEYLDSIGESELLDNLILSNTNILLSDLYHSRNYTPSIRRQIASVLAALGEYDLANSVHTITWVDLSPRGDKISNGIIKRFGYFERHAV